MHVDRRITVLVVVVMFCLGTIWFYRWSTKPVTWQPDEVAKLLQTWLDGDIDYAGWDYFEACSIEDPDLERIRQEAIALTWAGSEYVINVGGSDEHLSDAGRSRFRQVIAKCEELRGGGVGVTPL